MAAVKMTAVENMRLFSPDDLKPCLLKNIKFPLIIVIVTHVLRNNHCRNTCLVLTPEITATLKIILATTRVILATNKLVSAREKVIQATTKWSWLILATAEVITST